MHPEKPSNIIIVDIKVLQNASLRHLYAAHVIEEKGQLARSTRQEETCYSTNIVYCVVTAVAVFKEKLLLCVAF